MAGPPLQEHGQAFEAESSQKRSTYPMLAQIRRAHLTQRGVGVCLSTTIEQFAEPRAVEPLPGREAMDSAA